MKQEAPTSSRQAKWWLVHTTWNSLSNHIPIDFLEMTHFLHTLDTSSCQKPYKFYNHARIGKAQVYF